MAVSWHEKGELRLLVDGGSRRFCGWWWWLACFTSCGGMWFVDEVRMTNVMGRTSQQQISEDSQAQTTSEEFRLGHFQ